MREIQRRGRNREKSRQKKKEKKTEKDERKNEKRKKKIMIMTRSATDEGGRRGLRSHKEKLNRASEGEKKRNRKS